MFALIKKKVGLPYYEIVGLFEEEETAHDAQQLLDTGTSLGDYYYRVSEHKIPPVYNTAEEAYKALRM